MDTIAKNSKEDQDSAAVEKLGKVFKSKDMSLKVKAKMLYTLVSPITCGDLKVRQ